MHHARWPSSIYWVLNLLKALVGLLATHKFRNHGAILLVNSGLVSIWSANRAVIVANGVLAANVWKLDVSVVASIIIRPYLSLNVVVGQHRVVKDDTWLRGMALSLLLVIIDRVDINDSLVVLAWVSLDRDDTGVWARLNLTLTLTIEKQMLFLWDSTVILLVQSCNRHLRRRVIQHARIANRSLSMMLEYALTDSLRSASFDIQHIYWLLFRLDWARSVLSWAIIACNSSNLISILIRWGVPISKVSQSLLWLLAFLIFELIPAQFRLIVQANHWWTLI